MAANPAWTVLVAIGLLVVLVPVMASGAASAGAVPQFAETGTDNETLDERDGPALAPVDRSASIVEGDGDPDGVRPVSVEDIREVLERGYDLPGPIAGLAGSERIDLHVRRANGRTAVFGVHTEDGDVVSVQVGGLESPTIKAYTTYRVVRTVQHAEEPGAELQAALADGRIRYDAVGLVNSIVHGFVKLGAALVGLMALLVRALGRP